MKILYEVGQPYSAGRTRWPEGAHYQFGGQPAAHYLTIMMGSPT